MSNLLADCVRDGIGHAECRGVCAASWLSRALQKEALADLRHRAVCDAPGKELPGP